MIRLVSVLVALPLFGQLSVICTAPSAILSWPVDPQHPSLQARVYPGTVVIQKFADQVAAGMQQSAIGTSAMFNGLAVGAYQAYLFQNSPYWQGTTQSFVCVVAPPVPTPQPAGGITITLDGKLMGTFSTLKLATGTGINWVLTDNKDGSVTVQAVIDSSRIQVSQ